MDTANRVPLTAGQKARLLADCVPLVAFLVMVLFYLVVWTPIVGAPAPFFYLFVAVVVALVGLDAWHALRDLQAGVALVADDRLERTWRGRHPGRRQYVAHFARLGRLYLTSRSRREIMVHAYHRLVYSPASKTVWSAEPRRTRYNDPR